jgi:transketolase
LKAAEMLKEKGVSIGVINSSCPLEVDREVMDRALSSGLILTMEDHHIDTGLGMTVGLYLLEKKYSGKFLKLGVKRYGSSGEPDYLFKQEGMDPESVAEFIESEA